METSGGQEKPPRQWRMAVYGAVAVWVLFFLLKQCNFDLFTMSLRKNPWVMNSCDRHVRAYAESPDRLWQATMVDFACGGFGAAGVFTTVAVVEVGRGREPSQDDEVVGAAGIYGEYSEITQLEWRSDKLLQITLPEGTPLYDLKTIHNNIAIEIIYDPPLPPSK
jgi:hypothetical protein